jgi:hypothetical protein
LIASTSPDRSQNVFKGLKIFKTNDFAQAEEKYRSLDNRLYSAHARTLFKDSFRLSRINHFGSMDYQADLHFQLVKEDIY